jgi:DNA repair protein RadC
LVSNSRIKFLNERQKVKYNALNEAIRRFSIEKLPNKNIITSTTTAGEYATKLFLNKKIEEFYLISLDGRNKVISADCMHKGTVNECIIYPRQVIKTALDLNAVNVYYA